MLRRLFTFLSIVSLLLCVATCVLWVRSYWRADNFAYAYDDRGVGRYGLVIINSDVGLLTVISRVDEVPPDRAVEYERAYAYRFRRPGAAWEASNPWEHPRPPEPLRNLVTAEVRIDRSVGLVRRRVTFPVRAVGRDWACVPHWAVVAVAAVLPAVWFRRRYLAGVRRSAGLCPSCGYDLRASPERCPECGAVSAKVTA